MTAINAWVTPTAAYLFSDAAFLDPKTLRVVGFATKIAYMPEYSAVMATSGNGLATSILAGAIAQHTLANFDHLIDNVSDIFQRCVRLHHDKPFFEDCRLVIAGYSKRTDAPGLYCLQTVAGIGIKPFEITPCPAFINPYAADENDRQIADMDFDSERPSESGLAIMRAQRVKFGVIGGWCQMTTVTRDGIETRVLERWPDKIGEKISPDA